MDEHPGSWGADTTLDGLAPTDGEDGGMADDAEGVEFEDDPNFRRGRQWSASRRLWRALSALVLAGLLILVVEQPDLKRLLHPTASDGDVRVTVVCDVPWAIIRVDGKGPATRCQQSSSDSLPMARFSVRTGQHTLMATADGFDPYLIYIVAHLDTPALYLTQMTPSAEGMSRALAAANVYFAAHYAQTAVYPAAFWQVLGLAAPPTSATLLVQEQFEAVGLDTYEPFYSETTYQRPIMPQLGAIGAAVVVVEHVVITDGCSATPLLQRRQPLLYATRASVTLSMRPGAPAWTATSPYALSPSANIYTAPNLAAAPATAANLMTLAARTTLATHLGSVSLLSGAVSVTPLTQTADWATGVVLTILNGSRQTPRIAGARPGALWLYAGGNLLSLTSAANSLSPTLPTAAGVVTLDSLRAGLANPPALCGGR